VGYVKREFAVGRGRKLTMEKERSVKMRAKIKKSRSEMELYLSSTMNYTAYSSRVPVCRNSIYRVLLQGLAHNSYNLP
jgi:hypothetical protein